VETFSTRLSQRAESLRIDESIRPDCPILFPLFLHVSLDLQFNQTITNNRKLFRPISRPDSRQISSDSPHTERPHFPPPRNNITVAMEFQINRIHQKEQDLPTGGNWVVQKFGGTSVGKFAVGIAQDIVL
jgi:hypothetical protein